MFIASISFLTADFDVERSFNTLKLIFSNEQIYLITFTKNNLNIITKIKVTQIMYDKQCLLLVFRLKQPILTLNGVLIL